MIYINVQTQEYPLSLYQIKSTNLNASIPDDFIGNDIYRRVFPSALPDYDRLTHKLIEVLPALIDGEYRQQWEIVPLSEVDAQQAAEAKRRNDEILFKQERQSKVDAIIVTTQSGKRFDGDEVSQNRMSRAIVAMSDSDTIMWMLADNTSASVTANELKEALRLAGEEMTCIWIAPS